MVYCGIPSKACSPCRSKRTKCDLVRPSCTQCKRTGRACGGYRDHGDLQIRNQSHAIVAKHSGVKSKSWDPVSLTDPVSTITAPNSAKTHPLKSLNIQKSIPKELFHLPEDVAACFFFNEYVLQDSMVSHNLFDVLPRLYSKAPAGIAISNTIIALGMACISNNMNLPEVMGAANQKYVEALRSTNSALRHPIEAKLDQTLVIVILLGLYEEIVNSLVSRVHVPEKIIKWSKLARQYETGDEHTESQLAEIIAEYCNLQSTVDSTNAEYYPISILERALEIDIELADWATAHQITNLYTSIVVDKSCPEVFWDQWHKYGDVGMAAICNHYRSVRVLINQMIIVQFQQLPDETDVLSDLNPRFSTTCSHQIEVSKRLVIELCHDICSSPPYFLGDGGSGPPSTKRANGKLLLWPLYVAGQTEYVSDVMRTWVIGRLERLADVAGIHKAVVLATMLRTGTYTRKVWREHVPEEAWYSKNFSKK